VREGAFEGGLGRLVKRVVSGELAPLVKIEGRGIAYLADQKKYVSVLRLGPQEAISVNGNDLLAFEDSVRHEITMHRRVAGMLAGGLFSVRLDGPGMIALMTHGQPLTLRSSAQDPVTTDPHATVAWSASLVPEIRTDVSFRSLIGRVAARCSSCASRATASWWCSLRGNPRGRTAGQAVEEKVGYSLRRAAAAHGPLMPA